jgi:tetratricopeptide (TPR) repeat protein
MKKLTANIAIGLALTCAGVAQNRQAKELSAAAWYQKGMAALKAGKPETAKTAFHNVLRIKPGYAPAKFQLARIPELNARAKVARRKALFDEVKIPEINFNKATLEEALEALDVLITKASNKKLAANFVLRDPKSKVSKQQVTLKMKNIPASIALRYILDGTGASARFDEHATVIKPLGE